MKLMRSYPTYQEYQRAMAFRSFSVLVDRIDFARLQLPEDDRSKSLVLDGLYCAADKLLLRLKRLGGY